MKPTAIILTLIALASPCISQTLADKTFLVRAETSVIMNGAGLSHTCVLVFPDGKYRLEKSFQREQNTAPDSKVFLDTLPETSLKQLQSVLDDPKLAAIKTPEPPSSSVQDLDALGIIVPREHGLQNVNFMTAKERKPYKNDLEPFQNWMKDVDKRKVPQAKQEKANNCVAPQVGYRPE
jgi:hypothetical protein